MAKTIESTPQQLVIQFGSTKLTLDKTSATASLHRKMLFWALKPVIKSLSDIHSSKLIRRWTGRLASSFVVLRWSWHPVPLGPSLRTTKTAHRRRPQQFRIFWD